MQTGPECDAVFDLERTGKVASLGKHLSLSTASLGLSNNGTYGLYSLIPHLHQWNACNGTYHQFSPLTKNKMWQLHPMGGSPGKLSEELVT